MPKPRLLLFNTALADDLGLDYQSYSEEEIAAFLSGAHLPPQSRPLAQAYAGHQFGQFSPQLGDGRALLLGEICQRKGSGDAESDSNDRKGESRYDIQLKGSGRTAFSRNGDGKAALGPVLREYLLSEAMVALGIPTTRALAVVTTGADVQREEVLPGAVLTRVAASHIRIGTFQFFAAHGGVREIQRLADYTIARHYPEAAQAANPYLALLGAVMQKQAQLVAGWMGIGFVHGVMNTDNTAISGETLDYGPCAFIDSYSASAVFSSIDRYGRYAFGKQPSILHWNLARLAEALLPAILAADIADGKSEKTSLEVVQAKIEAFPDLYLSYSLAVMRRKLGLHKPEAEDERLIAALLEAMESHSIDFSIFFRWLAVSLSKGSESLDSTEENSGELDKATLDRAGIADEDFKKTFAGWHSAWQARLQREDTAPEAAIALMNRCNPYYIPRNHLVEEALQAAVASRDMQPYQQLQAVLAHPYQPAQTTKADRFAAPPPPDFGRYVTYCGT